MQEQKRPTDLTLIEESLDDVIIRAPVSAESVLASQDPFKCDHEELSVQNHDLPEILSGRMKLESAENCGTERSDLKIKTLEGAESARVLKQINQ